MNDGNDQNTLFESKANLQKNIETVGGKLLLFKQHLEFRPHSFNVQREPLSIALASILEIESGWTKLFGFIPIFPNAIILFTKNEKQYRFTVSQRNIWISKIKAFIQ